MQVIGGTRDRAYRVEHAKYNEHSYVLLRAEWVGLGSARSGQIEVFPLKNLNNVELHIFLILLRATPGTLS